MRLPTQQLNVRLESHFGQQAAHLVFDLIATMTHGLDSLPGRIRQLPVLVSSAVDEWASITSDVNSLLDHHRD